MARDHANAVEQARLHGEELQKLGRIDRGKVVTDGHGIAIQMEKGAQASNDSISWAEWEAAAEQVLIEKMDRMAEALGRE